MRIGIISAVISAVVHFALFADTTNITAVADLEDGSTIVGKFLQQRLTGSTVFTEKLTLDASIIKNLASTDTNGNFCAVLVNGDRITFCITEKKLPLETILGELDLPVSSLRKLSLSTDNTENNGNVIFKFDGPLLVNAHETSSSFKLPAGTLGHKGKIEFKGTILSNSEWFSDGGNPCFFMIKLTSGAWLDLSITANNGRGKGGICAPVLLPRAASIKRYSNQMSYFNTIGSDWRKPHLYAMLWNENGITGISDQSPDEPVVVAIYLDGKLIATAGWEGYSRKSFNAFDTQDATLDFGHFSNVGMQIENFKIYDSDDSM